jgi:hypothetical protein
MGVGQPFSRLLVKVETFLGYGRSFLPLQQTPSWLSTIWKSVSARADRSLVRLWLVGSYGSLVRDVRPWTRLAQTIYCEVRLVRKALVLVCVHSLPLEDPPCAMGMPILGSDDVANRAMVLRNLS